MNREQFELVMCIMDLLRKGKITSMTPNCDVRDLVLKELKSKEKAK